MREITYEEVLATYNSKEAGKMALNSYMHWFPLSLTPKIAGIVADLMGDGHLQGSGKWRLDYTSASIGELQRFNQEIKEAFGCKGTIRSCTTNAFGKTFNLGVNCNPLGRLLSICGVPAGSKVLTVFTIPCWIVDDKECFRQFIKRLCDCEGTIDAQAPAIEIRMWKEQSLLSNGRLFFEAIKQNLQKHFDIQTTRVFLGGTNLRKDGRETIALRLKVKRIADVIRFSQEIGFDTPQKHEKLMKVIEKLNKKNGSAGI